MSELNSEIPNLLDTFPELIQKNQDIECRQVSRAENVDDFFGDQLLDGRGHILGCLIFS